MIIFLASDSYSIIYNSNVTSENLDINVYFTLTLLSCAIFKEQLKFLYLYGIGLSKLNRDNIIKTQLCLEDLTILFYKGYTLCIDSLERR